MCVRTESKNALLKITEHGTTSYKRLGTNHNIKDGLGKLIGKKVVPRLGKRVRGWPLIDTHTDPLTVRGPTRTQS